MTTQKTQQPPPRKERKLDCLTLFNPWEQTIALYKLGVTGLKKFRDLGQVKVHDVLRQCLREPRNRDAAQDAPASSVRDYGSNSRVDLRVGGT